MACSFALVLAACVGLVVAAEPAHADTTPVSGTPATVSADALPTVQQNGVVWSQVTVGNTVYATGSFSQTWPAGAANTSANYTPRSNLLAFDITTGALLPFNHVLNAQGLTIAASPNGSTVYVGGDFTTVDGVARNHIAAFSTSTGALTSFAPNVTGQVDAIAVSPDSSTVYVGGSFLSVGGNARTRLAAFTSAGALTTWAPTADDNTVTAMVVTPDQSEVVIGGRFSSMNGSSTPGLGAVTTATGASVPYAVTQYVKDFTAPNSASGQGAGITSLTTDGTQVYGSGYSFYQGNFEGTFGVVPDTGAINFLNDCHGDTYSTFPIGKVLYVASHVHDCSAIGQFPDTTSPRVAHHATAYTTYTSGGTNVGPDAYGWNYNGVPDSTLLDWFPTLTIGSVTGQNQATWSVTGNSNYVAYGGEFPSVNGTAQQGLVRFAISSLAPNKVGPIATSTLTPTVVSLRGGTARVSWTGTSDPDNQLLTYNVYRDNGSTPVYTTKQNSTFWQLPAMGFTDTGLTPGSTHTYRVQVLDPFGNKTGGNNSAPVTISSTSTSSPYLNDVTADGASDLWRFNESSGTTAYDWAGYSDMTEGTGVTEGAPGPLASDPATAATFNGTSAGSASTTTAVQGPNTFSVEGWFNTTTTSGGKIVGFGNTTQGNTSSSYDRQIYMDNAGHLVFGVYNSGIYTVSSSQTYNDGKWHYVVGELSGSGMAMYVDGKLIGQNQGTTVGQPYTGYWRVGGDNLAGWPAQPTSNWFNGAIGDVAVYPTALTIQQVQKHYSDAGGSVTTLPPPTDAYGKAVYNDNPLLYWRLNETSGPTAVDASPYGDNGTYSGGVTYGTPSPVTTVGSAVTLDGQNGLITSTQTFNNPTVYSEELWFNTTTTSGGKLIGFGDQPTGNSNSYDRHVYMLNTGQLEFGTYNGQLNTIISPNSYNDGKWHYMVATQGPAGMVLYVDGQQVGTNPNTQAQNYTGYWRVGGDQTWGGASSNYFAGSIDEVAVYGSQLSAAQVSAHYQASPIAVTPPPTAKIATPNCTGLNCSFDGTGSTTSKGTITGYSWDFGDGSTSTSATPSHTYAASGTYTVTLTVTDSNGGTGKTSTSVTVAPVAGPPAAAFTSSCPSLTCSFDGTTTTDPAGAAITSYAWNFGDGTTGTGSKPSHTYAAAGTYQVTLTATDANGQKGSVTNSVSPAPTGNPTINPYATDNFNRTVSGGWGTATTGGAWTPTGSGTNLSVSNGVGSLKSPAAGVGPGAYLGSVSSTDTSTLVTFTTSGTITGGGLSFDVVGRRINSNTDYRGRVVLGSNGSVGLALLAMNAGTQSTVKTTYTLPGITYTPGMQLQVELQVTGTAPTTMRMKAWPVGGTQPTSWQITGTSTLSGLQVAGSVGLVSYLSGSATSVPVTTQVSSFSTGPTQGLPTAAFASTCSGQSCSTDANGSTDPSGTISSYQWNWGDGVVTSGVTSNHTYASAGTYTITLTVTDPSGWTSVVTKNVTVPA